MYTLYFEDLPYVNGTPCTGLSRVNSHIIKALEGSIKSIILRAKPFSPLNSQIDVFGNKAFAIGSVERIFRNLWLKVFKKHISRYGYSHLSLRSISKSCQNAEMGLFAPIGTNPEAVLRAESVAKYLNLEVSYFLVDDLLESFAHEPTFLSVQEITKNSLRTAKMLYCATDKLTESYAQFGDTTTLPMPFQPRVETIGRTLGTRSNEIVFLGSPSHFYQDGIVALCETVPHLEKGFGPITIRFTIDSPFLRFLKESTNANITISPYHSELSMAEGLNNSLFSFVSYSFSPKYKPMTESSFPSKLFEYLAFSKSIVCWAPPTSTAAKFFLKHDLPGLLTIDSREQLKFIIESAIYSQCNHGIRYRESLCDFSYDTFNKILQLQ